jgi:hypothetical protein
MQNLMVNSGSQIPWRRLTPPWRRKVAFINLFYCKPLRKSSATFPKGGLIPEAEFMNIWFCEVSRHIIDSSQAWGFCIQCLHYKLVSNHFFPGGGGDCEWQGGRLWSQSFSRIQPLDPYKGWLQRSEHTSGLDHAINFWEWRTKCYCGNDGLYHPQNRKKQSSSKKFRSFNSGGSVNVTTRNARVMVWILDIIHTTVYSIRQGGHLSFSVYKYVVNTTCDYQCQGANVLFVSSLWTY